MSELRPLLRSLWQDDGDAVVATEYMLIGSILVVGVSAGLVSVRDATNDALAD